MFMEMMPSHILCLLLGFVAAWTFKPSGEADRTSQEQKSPQEFDYHFLFNSLTTIRFLTKEDAKKAGELVLCLSQFLKIKWSLQSCHSLARELELSHAYLRLEEGRLEERLRLEWDVATLKDGVTLPKGQLQTYLATVIDQRIRKSRSGGQLSVQVSQVECETMVSVFCNLGVHDFEWDAPALIHLEEDRLVLRFRAGDAELA